MMLRKAFGIFLDVNPGHFYENRLPKLVGNVGLIFTNSDLNLVAEIIKENKKEAPAKAGAIAPTTLLPLLFLLDQPVLILLLLLFFKHFKYQLLRLPLVKGLTPLMLLCGRDWKS